MVLWIGYMPRRRSGLDRVVSTKVSADDFDFLERYARFSYIKNYIPQPTVSQVLRVMVSDYRRMVMPQKEFRRDVSANRASDKNYGSTGISHPVQEGEQNRR